MCPRIAYHRLPLRRPGGDIFQDEFNSPGYQLFAVMDLAVAGSGGGDPGPGTYPANMLIEYVRVW